MENMTRAPYLLPSGRFGARMGDAQLIDSMVHDGLWDAFNDIHMGITAENLADQYGVSREEQDEFAPAASRRPSGRSLTGCSVTRSWRSRFRLKVARGWLTATKDLARGRLLTRWRSYARRFGVRTGR